MARSGGKPELGENAKRDQDRCGRDERKRRVSDDQVAKPRGGFTAQAKRTGGPCRNDVERQHDKALPNTVPCIKLSAPANERIGGPGAVGNRGIAR